ncbi:MAG: hypothetical protein H6656_08615 [Ardenticatenaceae bacterium]|nr:hypothetical protein [Anaerolineales bacterium]MCB9007406.1 hypothetical protein [Ardenticatenaceae bacterium]
MKKINWKKELKDIIVPDPKDIVSGLQKWAYASSIKTISISRNNMFKLVEGFLDLPNGPGACLFTSDKPIEDIVLRIEVFLRNYKAEIYKTKTLDNWTTVKATKKKALIDIGISRQAHTFYIYLKHNSDDVTYAVICCHFDLDREYLFGNRFRKHAIQRIRQIANVVDPTISLKEITKENIATFREQLRTQV